MIDLNELKKECIVIDIETSANFPDGKKIDLRTNFDDYVKYAKVKFFGCYSYKYDMYVLDEVRGNEERIKAFVNEHSILVGFNNEEFDTPICFNNDLMPDKQFLQVDTLVVLGSAVFTRHDGKAFKNRGALMGYKFKNNSLRNIAKAMGLETQKGDIDYNIFFQDTYTQDEREEILKYLEGDVRATKEMFDKLWDFWIPFTDFLNEKNIKNLSWIRSSIASLTYKAACHTMGVEETYGEKTHNGKEEMGGRVIEPKVEEARDVWYVDFTSLYPHIFAMFNLFAEITDWHAVDQIVMLTQEEIWHGNDVFKVKGYYDISSPHPLSKDVAEKLVMRSTLSKDDPKRYAVKIFLNSLYGAARSEIFEQVHTPNCGWDCCWLGQQINVLTENMMEEFGFTTIAGDTDSIFVVAKEERFNNRDYVKECLSKVVEKIKANVPFPLDTYNIDIEGFLPYVKWPFSLQPVIDPETGKNLKKNNRLVKEWKGKKKNYLYIDENNKVKLVGLPIKKDNATALGIKIYKEEIEPSILEKGHASFPKESIEDVLNTYLQSEDNLKLLAREFKVKKASSYKNHNQLQAQISRGYFGGLDGVIHLIKNSKVGRAGKTSKYATAEEIMEAKLTVADLDLEKVRNELAPFVRREEK